MGRIGGDNVTLTNGRAIEDVTTGCLDPSRFGPHHLNYCRWCRIWSVRKLRKSVLKYPHNLAAEVFCRVLIENGKYLMSMAERGDSTAYQHFAVMALALADLNDVSRFHSFSQDQGKTWLSIESIAPRLPEGKVITRELIDNCGEAEIMAVVLGTAAPKVSRELLDHAKCYFPIDRDLTLDVWSWRLTK
jgi:hypothetical protein